MAGVARVAGSLPLDRPHGEKGGKPATFAPYATPYAAFASVSCSDGLAT